MVKKLNIPEDKNIIDIPIEEAMPENYLPYAVEVAKDRALPDVRDGLKPVHRRILYGAYQLKAYPDRPYYKSARIVGDILGKYHPHGDTSVYESMVIMAQDFTTREPLIDGHGNWGSIDGDGAAAMRYTEARLTKIAMEMLRDLDKDVVNMVPNYSDSEKEPEVLPARFPNLLVNGAFGIAVGLATNIPPHNLGEVIDAAIYSIDNKSSKIEDLLKFIKGPDLPTGGVIIAKESLLDAYRTGEGKVTLRAKCEIERIDNGKLAIVITEFPFRRNKARILGIISDMTGDKRHQKVLEPIADIRDESDRTGIRSVIEFKKSVDYEQAEKVLKYLYSKTDLQSNLCFNMVAIADGKPKTLSLKEILDYYIIHQKEVVTRRTKKELETAERRFEIIEGFIKAISIMDEIIKTIRASSSKSNAHKNLVDKFDFTDIQSDAILELMLYRLTGLEITSFEKEYKELSKKIKGLKRILESEKELDKVIKTDLIDIKNKYGNKRRTEIIRNEEEAKIDKQELILVEDTVVTISKDGFIKMIPLKTYNRSNTNVEDIEYREGDFNKFLLFSNTLDNIILFTDSGNMYKLKGTNIPEYKWKEKGERLDEIIKGMDLGKESLVAAYSISNMVSNKDIILITSNGTVKKTPLSKFESNYTKIMALKLKKDEKLVFTSLRGEEEEREIFNIETGDGLTFTIEEPELTISERNILGINMFSLPPNNPVINVSIADNAVYKTFKLNLGEDGKIRKIEDRNYYKRKGINLFTNTSSKIVLFTSDGNSHIVDAFMLENLEGEIGIESFIEGFNNKKCSLLNAVSTYDFSENIDLVYFTQKGMVKKTAFSEYNAESYSFPGYKIKKDDKLIGVSFSKEKDDEVILVSKKGMCIRFDLSSVSLMGRIASGVNGLSLEEDDELIFCCILEKESIYNKILLKSSQGFEKEINIDEIKHQNRAGKGKNIFLVVFDEYIKYVELG
ncbi:MAG: DNA topoisomerase IV subunit A [Clostridiaceae bacterium]